MEITANASQAVAVNNNVLFTDTYIPGNCSIIHREGSGLVTLRGLSKGQSRARFRITFSANVKADSALTITAATPISLAFALNGETIGTTTMNATVADTVSLYNVSTTTLIDIPVCCCQTLSVKNIGTILTDVINSNLIVERVA